MGTDEDPNLNQDCQRMGDNPDKFYSLPCNGAGSCRCGKCFCNENRIGDQCQCNALFCGKLWSFYFQPFDTIINHLQVWMASAETENVSMKLIMILDHAKWVAIANQERFLIIWYLQSTLNIRQKMKNEKGYTIDRTTKMCSCSTETENCISENGKQCGGKKQGHCNCNKCECNELYTTFGDEGKFSNRKYEPELHRVLHRKDL